jgi:DNA-binding CsgD family transcriptional regulator
VGASHDAEAEAPGRGGAWIPPWVQEVGAVVWVTSPDQRIVHVNARAEALLGRRAAACQGLPCFDVVCGKNARGEPHCRPRCAVQALAATHREICPFALTLHDPRGRPRAVEVLVVAARGPGGSGPWLVHCALDRQRAARAESYLQRLAARDPAPAGAPAPRRALTPRETEVLALLADAESLSRIAARLGLRRTTVRNHVQHILDKLGVHSMAQAVARHLLSGR